MGAKIGPTVGLIALAAVGMGCTAPNPGYCPEAGPQRRCVDAGVKKDAKSDASDAREAGLDAKDGPDGPADGAVDLPMEPKPICTTDDQCPADGGKLACLTGDAGAPMCVECTDSAKHCKDAKKPACDTTAHQCVQCVDDTQCSGTTPICDAAHVCRPCRADSECKTGALLCVDWDGHCAEAKEIIILQGGTCTPAPPTFCKPSDAVAQLNSDHPILAVLGPMPTGSIDPPSTVPEKVLIVGRIKAVVAAGAGDVAGVHIAGPHKVWVRDIAVSGGTVGIVAEQGAELHVTRALVTNNGKGGIKTIDSGFDITNTIVAGNLAGTDVGGVVWAGVRLGDVPAMGLARFAHNTVVDNKLIGVSCKPSTHDISTSIVFNNVGGDSANCAGTSCCGAGNPDPKLDAEYHLQAGSPCIDKITATPMSLTLDIQLQSRPTPPGKLDCGADELVP